jgi:hypothetical protein
LTTKFFSAIVKKFDRRNKMQNYSLYRIHVEGKFPGVDGTHIHTYEVPKIEGKPLTREAAKAIALVDFSQIDKLHAEEVSHSHRMLDFGDPSIPWTEPVAVKGEDDDPADE